MDKKIHLSIFKRGEKFRLACGSTGDQDVCFSEGDISYAIANKITCEDCRKTLEYRKFLRKCYLKRREEVETEYFKVCREHEKKYGLVGTEDAFETYLDGIMDMLEENIKE